MGKWSTNVELGSKSYSKSRKRVLIYPGPLSGKPGEPNGRSSSFNLHLTCELDLGHDYIDLYVVLFLILSLMFYPPIWHWF